MEDVNIKLTHVGCRKCEDIGGQYAVVTRDPTPKSAIDTDEQGNPDPGLLGRGTFGVVRRRRKADDTGAPLMAVKEIQKKPLSENPQLFVHTLVELSVLKCLKHPGCITLTDLLHSDSTLYVVTPLFGTTLYSVIAKDGAFSLTTTAFIMKQLLETLHYLHVQLTIVHRDVKPENILICKDTMKMKLIDFGLAKFIGQAAIDASCPSPGIAVTPGTCTIPYASLEVIDAMLAGTQVNQGKRKWTSRRGGLPKLDMYAAGVVCYAMLFTCLPFPTIDAEKARTREGLAVLKQIMKRGVRFPERAQHLPSQSCLLFIMQLMDTNPANRPTASEALKHAYIDLLAPAPCSTPGANPTTHTDPQPTLPPGSEVKTINTVHGQGVKISAPPKKGKKKGPKGEGKGNTTKGATDVISPPEVRVQEIEPKEEVKEDGAGEGEGEGAGAEVVEKKVESPVLAVPQVIEYTAVPSPIPNPSKANCEFKVCHDLLSKKFCSRKQGRT